MLKRHNKLILYHFIMSFFIVTVPTPIKNNYEPDLRFLECATEMIGKILKKGDIVVYESTVYPGTTENVCGKILEEVSKLKLNKDFYLAYSPERINPGDTLHVFDNINKIVSVSSEKIASEVLTIYSTAVSNAKIYMASNIKTAEASKIIENTQRDVNIAFMNEVSKIMHKFDIDTNEMLYLASTKWNFLNFKPGLVGGHCIGVDPYYLKYQSEKMGFNPPLITIAREVNEGMTDFIISELLKILKMKNKLDSTKILVKGLSFKENVDDIRNSKSIELIIKLKEVGIEVYIEDPIINNELLCKEYGLELSKNIPRVDAVIFAVSHDVYKDILIEELENMCTNTKIIFDLKSIFNKKELESRGFLVWNL